MSILLLLYTFSYLECVAVCNYLIFCVLISTGYEAVMYTGS